MGKQLTEAELAHLRSEVALAQGGLDLLREVMRPEDFDALCISIAQVMKEYGDKEFMNGANTLLRLLAPDQAEVVRVKLLAKLEEREAKRG